MDDKELRTELIIQLPSNELVLSKLVKKFPDYAIRYNSRSEIWEIKDKEYRHTIWYERNKESLLKTEKRKEYKELILVNLFLVIPALIFMLLNFKYHWISENTASTIFIISVGILSVLPILIKYFKSGFTENLEQQHKNFTQKIEKIFGRKEEVVLIF